MTYKIEMSPNNDVELLLRKNCEYRRFLYNKCVEIVKLEEENNNGRLKVKPYELLHRIRDMYEKTKDNPNSGYARPDYLEEYDYYFRGISECVIDDVSVLSEIIIDGRINGKRGDFKFLKYSENRLSFRFKSKLNKKCKCNGLYAGCRIILTENPYLIGLKVNNTQSPIAIELKESIDHFHLDLNTIKEIAIKFHNEKWFLCLVVDATDVFSNIKVFHKRKKVAGIDLGETDPVVLYDGKPVVLPKELQFPIDQIKKVEARIQRLQRVMDQKRDLRKDRFHQSKNYYKVLAKFHKAWEHLVNIKKDWHFKLAYWIVTHYKNIVVDEFKEYIKRIDSNYQTRQRKDINHGMYRKSMRDVIQSIHYMSIKYGTNYFKAFGETTNICCSCGYTNEHKLIIDANHNERIFQCESCGFTLDRDINASINCYHQYKILKHVML